jgi:hypothetical protein
VSASFGRDQTALLLALRQSGWTPEEIHRVLGGWVWLGDLAGMEVVPLDRDDSLTVHPAVAVTHRCGNGLQEQPSDGMSADGASMLGNLVERAVTMRESHSCRGAG